MSGFEIDEKQAEYIAEIKLRNINKEYILNRIKELENLTNDLKELNSTLSSESKIKNIICSQLKTVSKKYGCPRKTEIITSDEIKEIPQEDFIEDYGIKLFLTKQNYFKKVSLVSLRTSGEQKLKDDDEIVIETETTNRTEIIFFSDKQNVYKLKADAVNDTKVSSLGEYLPNILGMEEDENIIFFTTTTDYSGIMFFMFENGKAVKIPLESYKTKTNRKKLVNAYSAKSRLIFMTCLDEDSDFILTRDNDKACLFNTFLISLSATKTASGVQVYTLKKNSTISNVYPISEFISDDIEFYRTVKIPSTGHFIKEDDKKNNSLSGQISF
jgi:DNA gyrase subunit A